MSALIVELKKRHYVCGLFWQSLSRPRELRTEAVELSRSLNFDLMVLRKQPGVAQAGYASSREGARPGVLSLGAMVASTVALKGARHEGWPQTGSNWLCALKLGDDIWAYFAVRDDNFLPNGDFAGSKADMLERLHGDYGLGGWNAVIADAELEDQGFHNFSPATIDDFLPASSAGRLWLAPAWELKPVDPSKRRALVAASVVGVVGIAAIGGTLIWQREQAAAQALRDEQAAVARQRLAQQAGTAAPPPWVTKPTPREFARHCQGALKLISPGGWTLDEYSCTHDRASYSWSRGASTVAYLLEQVPAAQVELSGDKASFSQPLTPTVGQAEALLPSKDVLLPLLSRFQQLGLTLKLSPPPAPPKPLPGMAPAKSAEPVWAAYPLTLQSGGLAPLELASVLTQPGVRIVRATYKQGDWSMEGVVYAQ